MQCIGRTKSSKYKKRCANNTRFLFCWLHKFQLISVFTAVIAFGAGFAQLSGYSVKDFFLTTKSQEGIDIKVFFKGFDDKSDFILDRGKKTLLLVSIPKLNNQKNRVIYARAFIRPINYGKTSLSISQLTTTFSDKLWNPGAEIVEKASILRVLSGEHDFDMEVVREGSKWVSTRKLPRIDPLTGMPLPISFLLEIHTIIDGKEAAIKTDGEMEIALLGENYPSFIHTIDIRSIAAGSNEEFISLSKKLIASLRLKNYPDIPVIFALTGGETIGQSKDKLDIIEAKIHNFIQLDTKTVHEF